MDELTLIHLPQKMKISLLVVSLFTVLGGCALLPRTTPVEVNTIAIHAPMYHPPLPMEIQGVEVKFEVLTPEIMAEYLKLVEEGKAMRLRIMR